MSLRLRAIRPSPSQGIRRWAAAVVLLALLVACGPASVTSAAGAGSPTARPGSPTSSGGTTLVGVTVSVPDGLASAPFDQPRTLDVPPGWSAGVVARVPGARFLLVLPDGAVLVSVPESGGVRILRPDASGALQATIFLEGLYRPHDLVLARVDGQDWIYVSAADRVVRTRYIGGANRAGAVQTIVDGLPTASLPELHGRYGHELKNIAVHGDRIYVAIGSTCNVCVEDTRSDPQRAAIYSYAATGHNVDRTLYARGLRNAEGLAFRPGTDELWAAVNNRDNLPVPTHTDVDGDGQDDDGKVIASYVDNHPPEPFVHVRAGGFYGWPFCNPNPDAGLTDMPFDNDMDTNPDGKAADCSQADRIDLGLQAHSAPLGLTFTDGTAAPQLGALMALHGSWNRSAPTGYKIVSVPDPGGKVSAAHDLVTGWLGDDGAWGRPVDVAVEASGSLLVSDDSSGTVYRLAPPH